MGLHSASIEYRRKNSKRKACCRASAKYDGASYITYWRTKASGTTAGLLAKGFLQVIWPPASFAPGAVRTRSPKIKVRDSVYCALWGDQSMWPMRVVLLRSACKRRSEELLPMFLHLPASSFARSWRGDFVRSWICSPKHDDVRDKKEHEKNGRKKHSPYPRSQDGRGLEEPRRSFTRSSLLEKCPSHVALFFLDPRRQEKQKQLIKPQATTGLPAWHLDARSPKKKSQPSRHPDRLCSQRRLGPPGPDLQRRPAADRRLLTSDDPCPARALRLCRALNVIHVHPESAAEEKVSWKFMRLEAFSSSWIVMSHDGSSRHVQARLLQSETLAYGAREGDPNAQDTHGAQVRGRTRWVWPTPEAEATQPDGQTERRSPELVSQSGSPGFRRN